MKGSVGPELPKCHPTIRGRWAMRTYEAFQRKPGAIFDLTYHGDDGNEIAFMVLILAKDGVTLLPQDNDRTVHLSHQPSHTPAKTCYYERNSNLLRVHGKEIREALLAVAHQYETGELRPEALGP
jgi:hypothetical protein